jgi:hypothetical protein
MKLVNVNNSSKASLRLAAASSPDFVPGGIIAPASAFSLAITDAEETAGSVDLTVEDASGESVSIQWSAVQGFAAALPDNDTIDPRVAAKAYVDSDAPTTLRVEVQDAATMTCTIALQNQRPLPDGLTLVRRSFRLVASTTLSTPLPERLDPGESGTLTATRLGRPPAGFVDYAIESRPHELVQLGWANNAFNVASPSNGSANRTVPGIAVTTTAVVPASGPPNQTNLTVALVVTPGGGLDTHHVDVAPGAATSVAPPTITGIHRVFYAFEQRATRRTSNDGKRMRDVDDSVNVDGLAVSRLPLRLVVMFADGHAELGDQLTWKVSAAGIDVPSGSVWNAKGAHFKIPQVDATWADTPLVVSAARPSGERIEANFEVVVSGIEFFIGLVKKLEDGGLQPVQALDCLRVLAGYDDAFHKNMMGVLGDDHPSPGGLTPEEIAFLHSKLAHGGSQAAWVADLTGESVAIGHVVTGLLAAAHRDRDAYAATGYPFDNLWCETLGGDLGQSASMRAANPSVPLLGPGSGSEDCEIVADIDGLLLGDTGGSDLSSNTTRLSGMLERYYLTPIVHGLTNGTCASRFGSFTFARSVTLLQATNFAFAYQKEVFGKSLGSKSFNVPDAILEAAVDQFYGWLSNRQKSETILVSQLATAGAADTADSGN